MVTGLAPPHTVTNISAAGRAVARCRRPRQEDSMQQDNRPDTTRADASSRSTDVTDDLDTGDDPGITEELLVEEISIDGMCGVY
jgi:mycofactocin precursor